MEPARVIKVCFFCYLVEFSDFLKLDSAMVFFLGFPLLINNFCGFF